MEYINKLTKREIEVAIKICQEKPEKQIASEMGISTRTVSSFKARIMHKTKAVSVVGIALYAVKSKIYYL